MPLENLISRTLDGKKIKSRLENCKHLKLQSGLLVSTTFLSQHTTSVKRTHNIRKGRILAKGPQTYLGPTRTRGEADILVLKKAVMIKLVEYELVSGV